MIDHHWMKVKEVAEYLNFSSDLIYSLGSRGTFLYLKWEVAGDSSERKSTAGWKSRTLAASGDLHLHAACQNKSTNAA